MAGNGEIQWYFSEVKGTLDDDINDADLISCVEFNHDGEFLATGDKGGRVVVFQRYPNAKVRNPLCRRPEYTLYSTFQSHEPEFDYLKSLEIEEKINKIKWLRIKNPSKFLLSTNDKTIKLWKLTERDKRFEGFNLRDEEGKIRDPSSITCLKIPTLKTSDDVLVEASVKRTFANGHTYHINSLSVNSDQETYLSADDLRINLWHLDVTDQSFSKNFKEYYITVTDIVDLKPRSMEDLQEVITTAEFHPSECSCFLYCSSKGAIRLCDMRQSALCDQHAKSLEEPAISEDKSTVSTRGFFHEIVSSISDARFSPSGRYILSRDYLAAKVWDLQMEKKPLEEYPVHDFLRAKLCTLYENDCIFDKFECCWNGSDSAFLTGSYNNFFRVFQRPAHREVILEASRDNAKPHSLLKPRKVVIGLNRRRKDEISVDTLDFTKKILHTAWHPCENLIAVAATNNLFIFEDRP